MIQFSQLMAVSRSYSPRHGIKKICQEAGLGTGQLWAIPSLSLCSSTTIDLSPVQFAPAVALIYDMISVTDFSNAFARINRPLLFAYEPALEPNADFLNAKLGDTVRLERFDQAGHALFVDDPVRFNHLVEEFVESLPKQ
ncbi:MAG TPA: hypothetical protein VN939_23840 [Chthoniobacterales bacterium]|nr:hypothetical protein [Chthoniobacterales bacterium]